ncbi:hypothetical protein [Streptomyces sp. NPDC088816]|uniref:hypothetical protein n=1 Tax=Streptomyces sp. NPDC088816 TaxID=3365906 RepID=UPI003828D18B
MVALGADGQVDPGRAGSRRVGRLRRPALDVQRPGEVLERVVPLVALQQRSHAEVGDQRPFVRKQFTVQQGPGDAQAVVARVRARIFSEVAGVPAVVEVLHEP